MFEHFGIGKTNNNPTTNPRRFVEELVLTRKTKTEFPKSKSKVFSYSSARHLFIFLLLFYSSSLYLVSYVSYLLSCCVWLLTLSCISIVCMSWTVVLFVVCFLYMCSILVIYSYFLDVILSCSSSLFLFACECKQQQTTSNETHVENN